MNLLLIGLRGAGKSTVGRALAARRGARFIDLDDATLARMGAATVREAWRERGEAGFREAEAAALGEALRADEQVIALGGGTPTAPGAAELIERHRASGRARVVYLRCAPDALRARLLAAPGGAGENRPSLTGKDPLEEIAAVHAARDPLYLSLADVVIEAAGAAEDVATLVEAAV